MPTEYILRKGVFYRPEFVVRKKDLKGYAQIHGNTVDGGPPVPGTVRVYWENPDRNLILVSETQADIYGVYKFNDLNPDKTYFVRGSYTTRRDVVSKDVEPGKEPWLLPISIPVGVPLDVPLPIVNGVGTVSANYVSGSYPSGVTLNSGRLQGSWPTGTLGSYPVVFELTDDNGTVSKTLDITLYLLPLKVKVSPSFPYYLVVGSSYSFDATSKGGEGPYTYSVSSGTLPGLTLDTSSGELSGTVSGTGGNPYSFELTSTGVRGSDSITASGVLVEPLKWWRLFNTAANAGGYGSMTELEFMSNGARLPLPGGTPISSGDLGGYPKANAFDGVKTGNDCWAHTSNSFPNWIGYEHASAGFVDSVAVTSRQTYQTQAPKDFYIQSSIDGVNWVNEWYISGQTAWGANETRTFNRPVPNASNEYAYWRVLIDANNGSTYVIICELEFDGERATGGSGFASSEYDGVWNAAAAFDGVKNADQGWCSAAGAAVVGSYLGYSFSSARTVNSVSITARQTYLDQLPKDFRIQSSSDGINWLDEWVVTNVTHWTANETRVFQRP